MKLLTFGSGDLKISVYNSLSPELETILSHAASGLQLPFIRLIEDTASKDLTFHYVLIQTKENKIIAFFYLQQLKFSSKNLNIRANFLLNLFTSLLLRIRPFKILISGNLFAVNFPAIKHDTDTLNTTDVINLIIQTKEFLKCDVLMIKDLDESFKMEEMVARGFSKYEYDLTMTLNIHNKWKIFDDYMNDLKKKYKKRAQKIRASGKDLMRKELSAEQILEQSSRIQELFLNVCDRQPVRMGQVEGNYFFEYKKRFPDKFHFVAFYLKEKMVSFATYVEHGETLEVHYIGIDYEYNNSRMLYFNILFDGLEVAIQMRKQILELGRTAREAKANLGAEPVYFNDYILFNSPLAKLLSKFITNNFEQNVGDLWKSRSPFIFKESL